MKSFKIKGVVMVVLVFLVSIACVGCNLFGDSADVETEGEPLQEEESDDSSLTPYTAALVADVALEGSLSHPEGGFGDYTEKQLIQLVLPPAMYSFGNTYFALTDVLDGSAQMESRSISGLFRLNVEDEGLAIVDGDSDIIEVLIDHLDFELSGSLGSFTELLARLMSGSEPVQMDESLLMDIVLGGRVGLSTYMSFTDNSYSSLEEPVDTISSLFVDVQIEDFLAAAPAQDSDPPDISGNVSAEAYFSVATNLLIKSDESPTQYYRIPSTVNFKMRPLENSLENFMQVVNERGDGFDMRDPDDFISLCQAAWGVTDDSGFFTLSVEMQTDDGPLHAEIEDFEVITCFASM